MELIRKMTVEPTLFLQHVGDTLTYVIFQNLIIAKICRMELGQNSSAHCDIDPKDSLHSQHHNNETTKIKAESSEFMMWNSLVANSFPILIILWLGVWSDVHGRRKPSLILGLIGKNLRALGLILNAHFFDWDPFLLLLTATLPEALGGGTALIHSSAFAYITDSSGTNSRTFRMGLAEAGSVLGSPVGLFLGTWLFERAGQSYIAVFTASFSCHFVNLIYTTFWIPEISVVHPSFGMELNEVGPFKILDNEDNDLGRKKNSVEVSMIKYLINSIFGSFKTVLTKRKRHLRKCLKATLLIMVLYGTVHGEVSMRYLFARAKFGWTEKQFTWWTIAETISLAIGVIVVMPTLTKLFKLSDPLIGIIANLGRVSSKLCVALSPKPVFLYYASALDLPGAIGPLAAKSLISKIVTSGERGKAFAFLGFIETLVPLMAVPLYSTIFTISLNFDPSMIFYLSTLIFSTVLVIFGFLFAALKLKFVDFDNGEVQKKNVENIQNKN